MEPLPIDSDSAHVVYSSHTIEHITDQAAAYVFSEIFRVLMPGGYVRLTAPDIDLHYRAYRDSDRESFYWKDWYRSPERFRRIALNQPLSDASIEQLFLQRFAASVCTLHADGADSRIDDAELRRLFDEIPYEEALNYCCALCPMEIHKKYPGNHINWWNQQKLQALLREAGFAEVRASAYGQSYCPVIRDTTLFDNTHPKVSFYTEARK